VTANPIRKLLDRCWQTTLLPEGKQQSDGQLLERYLGSHDPLALEALVRRHALMVWGVCRRTLAHDDAEDAFQATFLVLLRKAGSIRPSERLANWLYGVAYKTARKALQTAVNRHKHETPTATMPEPATRPADDTFGPELLAELDRELSRLPEKYRVAIVLCHFQGKRLREAAQQLRLPEGTVASRLARGRQMLAQRLARHGPAVSATSVAAVLTEQAATGAVPDALLNNTITATTLLASGKTVTTGLVSAEVSRLAEVVLRGMAAAKWKAAGVVLLLASLAMVGGALAFLLVQRGGKVPAEPGPRAKRVTLVVIASYPGASAEEVERQVTVPLEVALAGMPGLRSARSKSLFGLSHVRLEFEDRVEYAKARQEVINRLVVIDRPLPAGVTPTLSPAAAGYDVLRYILRGPKDAKGKDVYTPADLRALQDGVVEREFRRVPGIIDVTSSGGTVKRYEVHPDPGRMKQLGITLGQIQSALANANANVGSDYIVQGDVAMNVRGVGLLGGGEDPVQRVLGMKDPAEAAARLRAEEQRRLREIRVIVITSINNRDILLGDVVEGGPLVPEEEIGRRGVVLGRRPGQPRVGLALPGAPAEDDRVLGVVYLRLGEDRQETLDRVKARVREINDTPGRLLPGVRIELLWERASGAEDDLLILRAGLPANVSPQAASDQMRQARAILLHYPEVRAVLTQFGPDETGVDPAGAESGEIYALLRPGKDRPRSRREILDAVQAELSRSLPGIDWEDLPDGVDDFDAAFAATPGAGLLKIIGPDFDELERLAGRARGELQKLAGVSGAHVRHVLGKTHLEFRVDPDKCARSGVSVADVKNVIAAAVGGRNASPMIEGEKTIDISIRWPNALRGNETSILDIPVDIVNNQVVPASGPGVNPPPAGSGQPAPSKSGSLTDTANPITSTPRRTLRDFVTPLSSDGKPDPKGGFERLGADAIWRENGRRLIAVRFSIRDRGEADVLAEAREKLAPLFPAPYQAEWSGGAR
jgi:RNA polymerase sigma factor (sigma-70 family)